MKWLKRAGSSGPLGSRSALIVLLVILLGGWGLYQVLDGSSSSVSRPSEASCRGEVTRHKFQIHPSIYFAKRFLPGGTLSALQAEELVHFHLDFIKSGWTSFDPSAVPSAAVIPSDGVRLLSVKTEEARYPLTLSSSAEDLDFHKEPLLRRSDLKSHYMLKALEEGVRAGDDAYRLSYEAELEFYVCNFDQESLPAKLPMPIDPLMAFLNVRPEDRVERRNSLSGQMDRVNPCASADFQYDNSPYYYWYYFSLSDRECRSRLIPGTVVDVPVLRPERIPVAVYDHDISYAHTGSGPLKGTVVLNMIADDAPMLAIKLFDDSISAKVDSYMKIDSFSEARNQLQSLSAYDPSFQSFLILSWSLRKMSESFSMQALGAGEEWLDYRLKGNFKRSGLPYDIRVVVGSALKQSRSFEMFYRALADGLEKSDFVYYGGHSGTGANLSKERLQEFMTQGGGRSDLKQQIFVVMSCYSLRYFPAQDIPVPSTQPGFQREFIYTGSMPSGYDARILLGLLENIDSATAGKTVVPFHEWSRQYKSDVFLMRRQVRN